MEKEPLRRVLMIASATSWLSTALALKPGPFGIFTRLRGWLTYKYGEANHPLYCPFCTSFYVGAFLILIDKRFPWLSNFFGVLGLSAALRGQSQEF